MRASNRRDWLVRVRIPQPAMELERKQEFLDQLTHDDPVGLVWFGDNDAWIGKRLRQWRIQAAPDELDGAHVVL